MGDGGSGNSPSSSLKASAKVEGLGSQSSSEVESSDVEGRGSDSEVEGHTYELSWKGRGSVVKLLLQQHAGQNGIKANPEKNLPPSKRSSTFSSKTILFYFIFLSNESLFASEASQPTESSKREDLPFTIRRARGDTTQQYYYSSLFQNVPKKEEKQPRPPAPAVVVEVTSPLSRTPIPTT